MHSIFQSENSYLSPFSPEPTLTSDTVMKLESTINQPTIEYVELNKETMREVMDIMKGKMDQLLEAMITLERKEDNP